MESPARSRLSALFLLAALIGCVGFLTSLGVWQVHRRVWKLALIERVDARVHAAPVPPPGPAAWPALTRSNVEYRHVLVTGRFAHGQDTVVHATTELGAGYWVLTPLLDDDGYSVLVNRGFIPSGLPVPPAPAGKTTIQGLVRMTEPKGGFLRRNQPVQGRWYSRDVAAIAAEDGISGAAPYFIDADGGAGDTWPRGGLTVIRFRNDHLMYALTWFGMAAALAITTLKISWNLWLVRSD